MKIILVCFLIIFNHLLFGQKIISYKFDKEHDSKTLFAGRILPSVETEYTKMIPTTFIFDTLSNTVKINSKVWKIADHESNCYTLSLYKNISSDPLVKIQNCANSAFYTRKISMNI